MTESEKLHLREVALKMARDLNPNTYHQQNQQWGMTGHAMVAPSINTIINSAERIFSWLKDDIKADKPASMPE